MYWIWGNKHTNDNEVMIYGPLLDEDGEQIELETGLIEILEEPLKEIIFNHDTQDVLADSILLRGGGGLLFSSRLRKGLLETGCNNIQYFPVTLRNAANGFVTTDYYLSNIIGRIACLDLEKSEYELSQDDEDIIEFVEALTIDKEKIPDVDLFRLHEDPEIVITSERVKSMCEKNKITGLKFYDPGNYL